MVSRAHHQNSERIMSDEKDTRKWVGLKLDYGTVLAIPLELGMEVMQNCVVLGESLGNYDVSKAKLNVVLIDGDAVIAAKVRYNMQLNEVPNG